MTAARVSAFTRQPHLSEATASEPDARYTVDLHRWLIQWHQEYATAVNNVVTGYLPLDGSGTMTGNLAFSGTGLRITGDFSNATLTSRVAYQTSTANAATTVQVLPNGTGTESAFAFFSKSDGSAAQPIGVMLQSGSVTALSASTANSGAQGTVALEVGTTQVLVGQTNTDVTLGPSGAATTMSTGFPYVPAAAGAPTGTPTARTGYVPLYYDSTGNNLYAYNGGGWKKVALA